jgi:hypothetical protein
MYIARREGFGGEYLYFVNNDNDSPKWSTSISEGKRFSSEKEALSKSDISGLYSITAVKVES